MQQNEKDKRQIGGKNVKITIINVYSFESVDDSSSRFAN